MVHISQRDHFARRKKKEMVSFNAFEKDEISYSIHRVGDRKECNFPL